MKFTECKEADQINYLKEEFYRCIEEMLIDSAELQKILSEEHFKTVKGFVPTLLAKECNCGTCLSLDKLDTRIPGELESLFAIARKRCEERSY